MLKTTSLLDLHFLRKLELFIMHCGSERMTMSYHLDIVPFNQVIGNVVERLNASTVTVGNCVIKYISNK